MAIYRAPRAPHPASHKTISPAARRHMAEAMRLLYDNAPGLSGDEALAERERFRREDEARTDPQSALPLELQP
ncbi:hypothetical protein [Xanthomonas arboricola]|nr:hypothetical protein [Xanthomonas arboricola]